jgi:hypothetical protein
MTTVAAFGIAIGAAAFAQTPSPSPMPAPGMGAPAQPKAETPAPAAPAAPEQAAPAAPATPDQSSAAASDQAAPAKPMHHRHIHHAVATSDDQGGDHWAHQPGTGESGPASTKASNIDGADTKSDIAPHLPSPPSGESGTVESYLQDAQSDLKAHKTGAAQQALEMAETRLLDRSTPVDAANQPDQNQAVQQVSAARKALASGDTKAASDAIQTALTSSK